MLCVLPAPFGWFASADRSHLQHALEDCLKINFSLPSAWPGNPAGNWQARSIAKDCTHTPYTLAI